MNNRRVASFLAVYSAFTAGIGEMCVFYEDDVKAISEGKQGSAFCMLECNPSHSAFKEKDI